MQAHGVQREHFIASAQKYKRMVRRRDVTTNNEKIYQKIKLLRNHGLEDRDTVKINGYNSRLDTIRQLWKLAFES